MKSFANLSFNNFKQVKTKTAPGTTRKKIRKISLVNPVEPIETTQSLCYESNILNSQASTHRRTIYISDSQIDEVNVSQEDSVIKDSVVRPNDYQDSIGPFMNSHQMSKEFFSHRSI